MESNAAAPPSVHHVLKCPAPGLSRWNEEGSRTKRSKEITLGVTGCSLEIEGRLRAS